MKTEDLEKHVTTLTDKAAIAEKSEDAVKFSQAACNISHVIASMAAANLVANK